MRRDARGPRALTLKTLRVIGPPGSGKTLLITSLTEALRVRGHRVASAARRDGLGASSTVLVLPGGARATLEGAPPLDQVARVLASIDPRVDLLLAEGYDDAGTPAVALSTERGPAEGDVIAVVASETVRAAFERSGPGDVEGLAALIEREVMGIEPAPGARRPAGRVRAAIRGLLRRG